MVSSRDGAKQRPRSRKQSLSPTAERDGAIPQTLCGSERASQIVAVPVGDVDADVLREQSGATPPTVAKGGDSTRQGGAAPTLRTRASMRRGERARSAEACVAGPNAFERADTPS